MGFSVLSDDSDSFINFRSQLRFHRFFGYLREARNLSLLVRNLNFRRVMNYVLALEGFLALVTAIRSKSVNMNIITESKAEENNSNRGKRNPKTRDNLP